MIRYCYFIVVDDTNEKEVLQEAIDYINGNYENAKIVDVETEKCKIQARNNVIKSKGKITFEYNPRRFMVSRNSEFGDYQQFYSEEEILKNGLSVYEYDSIVEVKQLESTDEIYKIFKESKQKSIETRMLNIARRNTTK